MRRGLPHPSESHKPPLPAGFRRHDGSAASGQGLHANDGRHCGSSANNNETGDIDDTESVELWSGFIEGQVEVDLDAMKSLVSRRSIYQRAFFNEDDEDEDLFEEFDLSTALNTCQSDMTEVHMSTDQNDGSEIIAPSQTDKTFTCFVSARMGCRRHWVASLGHVSTVVKDAQKELAYDSCTPAAAAATTAAADGGCLTLQFSFQPDEMPDQEPSTFLVLKLIRLANNLRRIMYSKSSRTRGSNLSKSSENRSDDSSGSR